jgi:hypothetical protein
VSEQRPEVWPAERALLQRLRSLRGDEVLIVGVIPAAALEAWPDRVTDHVVITAERRRHYLQEHPEVEELELLLLHTLFDPEEVHLYDPDKAVANLYRSIDTRNDLMVSVWISHESDKQNSLHSARIQHHRRRMNPRKKGRGLWRK